MEIGKAIKYNIQIEPSMNMGFIVKVGCGEFVAKNKKELIENLIQYLNNPEQTEKQYNAVNTDAIAEVPTPENAERRPQPERMTTSGSHN